MHFNFFQLNLNSIHNACNVIQYFHPFFHPLINWSALLVLNNVEPWSLINIIIYEIPQIGGLGLVLPKLETQKEVRLKTVWKAQGTKLVSDLNWSKGNFTPKSGCSLLVPWLAHILYGIRPCENKICNLLNWYLLSWNGTQFPSLYIHKQIEDEQRVRGSNRNVTLQITVLHRAAL